jgi:hypothetical protein
MEKNGRLQERAPSVVSGKPSDSVDPVGEPVVDGEKSASFVPPVTGSAYAEDFDKPRET